MSRLAGAGCMLAALAVLGVPRTGAAQLPLAAERNVSFDTDEGTWMSVAVSPDGQTLAFDLLGDIYTLPVQGGTARQITAGMAYDSQPAFSPDGKRIAFLSDRSGAENLWVARVDGTEALQISVRNDNPIFVTPAWSADGSSIYVCEFRADLSSYELWKFAARAGGAGERIIPSKPSPSARADEFVSTLGVTASRDGRFIYYASHTGRIELGQIPQWTIKRRNLKTGEEETVVYANASPRPDLNSETAFRPVLSPDGRRLVYGTHLDGRTGLRLLDLDTLTDRSLAYPVQQDQLGASSWSDLLPGYAFTPDGRALILSDGGKLRRLDVASGDSTVIPFRAHVSQDLGPFLRVGIRQETGPVRARIIQTPEQSPDGRRLVFSALAHLWIMDLERKSRPRRLEVGEHPAFMPSWSPDGHDIVYVTWTARDGGHLWRMAADRPAPPVRLTEVPAFYTSPVYTPDGRTIVALRSSNYVRMHAYMEYGALRQAQLIRIPATGAPATVIATARMGGKPQLTRDAGYVYLNFDDGLNRVALDGSGRSRVLQVVGPGWYFSEGPAPVDDLKISPDGRWALAQLAQQLHLLEMPAAADKPVDLSHPSVQHRKLTDVGADFFDWADGGRTVTWAVGSTFYRRPLSGVRLDEPTSSPSAADVPRRGERGLEQFAAIVETPRDLPRGTLVLRGGTAITMKGAEVINDADVVIVDDHIAAIGARGAVKLPPGASIRDVSGKYLVPGFIDDHDHLADVRRGVLDLQTWGPLANLAYGVTTAFDPSPLSIDMLIYEDLMDSGQMLGSRIHSTGPALFSFNAFNSYEEVLHTLSRYPDHYRTRNLKEYRTGNRRVRQWVAMASKALGLMPTTEGALSMKLDLSQIIDGFSGNEHALVAYPLSNDVVELVARSRVSYTMTLGITNGGPEGQDYYLALNKPHDDPKLNRFAPHYVVDLKTLERTWRDPREYQFPRIAGGGARVLHAGGVLGVGSHGEIPGLGFHWELQAYVAGGFTPAEALRAATLGSAEAIGRQEFGSLESGKYADLLILDENPLLDIRNTLSLREVMKNGRLYDARTLDELWPRRRPLPPLWFWEDGPAASPPEGGSSLP